MSGLLILAAASAMAAPVVDRDTTRAMLREYPSSAVNNGKSAAAAIEISVTPDGKVFQCETLSKVGDDRLAQEGCRFFADETLTPARDAAGQPVFGRLRTLVKYFLPGQSKGKYIERLTSGPDASFELSRLPNGIAGPVDIGVPLHVDSAGAVAGCEAVNSVSETLGKIACEALAGKQVGTLLDSGGTAVPYVTAFRVRFSAAPKT